MGNGEVVVQVCLTNQERTTEDSEKRNRKADKVNETDMGEVETCNKHNEETLNGNPKPSKVERRERQWPEKRGVAGIKTFVNPFAPLSSAPTGFFERSIREWEIRRRIRE